MFLSFPLVSYLLWSFLFCCLVVLFLFAIISKEKKWRPVIALKEIRRAISVSLMDWNRWAAEDCDGKHRLVSPLSCSSSWRGSVSLKGSFDLAWKQLQRETSSSGLRFHSPPPLFCLVFFFLAPETSQKKRGMFRIRVFRARWNWNTRS